MTVAERLDQAPPIGRQPEFPATVLNRSIRKVFIPIINASGAIVASEDIVDIIDEIKNDSHLTDTPKKILLDNLTPIGHNIYLSANKTEYPDTWYRDNALSLMFLHLPKLETALMRLFESRQLPNGQIPTAIARIGDTSWHRSDDETTMLYIIEAYTLTQKTDGQFIPNPDVLKKAIKFIYDHVYQGIYITPGGTRHGWIDSFDYENRDVITQNQGLFAVALLAGEKLGLPVNKHDIHNAIEIYQDLAASYGFLPLSAHHDYAPDASALLPEFIALTVFHDESLLGEKLIRQTWESLPRSLFGYQVLSLSRDGDYFPPSRFKRPSPGGNYHNGADFPNVSAMVEAVRKLHAIHTEENIDERILFSIEPHGFPEWLATDGSENKGPKHQLWNIAIPVMLESGH